MEYKLKDIITFKPGYAFKKSDMADIGIDLVKIGNLKNNKVIIPSDTKIKEDTKFKDFIINKNDILMALTGDPVYKGNIQTWVGRTSMYLNNKIAYLNQRVCKLIPDEKIIVGNYLYYWLIRYDKTYEIAGLFHGSANQANISHKEVGEMFIELPKLDIQKKIAKILTDIDKKINLNNQINDNLYKIGTLCFNNYIDNCCHSEITISEIADEILDYTKNKKAKVKLLNSSDVTKNVFPIIEFVDNYNLKGHFKKRFKKYDILYSQIRPRNNHYGYVLFEDTDDYLASTRFMVVRNKEDKVSSALLYFYLTSENAINDFASKTESRSGTFPQGNYADLSSFKVKYDKNQSEITKVLECILEKIYQNEKENQKLEQLRDTLLPKLMNGEIDLDNIEI